MRIFKSIPLHNHIGRTFALATHLGRIHDKQTWLQHWGEAPLWSLPLCQWLRSSIVVRPRILARFGSSSVSHASLGILFAQPFLFRSNCRPPVWRHFSLPTQSILKRPPSGYQFGDASSFGGHFTLEKCQIDRHFSVFPRLEPISFSRLSMCCRCGVVGRSCLGPDQCVPQVPVSHI